MFENRRMPNGTSEPSLGLCGVGGRACEGSLYPMRCRLENFAGVVSQTATFAALQRDVACVGPSAELLNDVGEP